MYVPGTDLCGNPEPGIECFRHLCRGSEIGGGGFSLVSMIVLTIRFSRNGAFGAMKGNGARVSIPGSVEPYSIFKRLFLITS